VVPLSQASELSPVDLHRRLGRCRLAAAADLAVTALTFVVGVLGNNLVYFLATRFFLPMTIGVAIGHLLAWLLL